MSKKLTLDFIPDFEFLLLGIVSYEKDYRLAWEINQKLLMDFARTGDHSVKHRQSGTEQLFSCYYYDDDNTYLNYRLLSNRSENGILLDAVKNIDYLLVISGEYFTGYEKQIRSKLIKLEGVNSCFILEPGKIKGCERVL